MKLTGYRGILAGDLKQCLCATEESTIDILDNINLLQSVQDYYDYYICNCILDMIDRTYDSWYKNGSASITDIKIRAFELLDLVIIFKEKDGGYQVVYCMNAVKGAKDFYDGHYLIIYLFLDSKYGWDKKYGFKII